MRTSQNRKFQSRAYPVHDRTFQEMYPMQKSTIMMLIASSVLIGGILLAGCTDSSSGVETASAPPTAAGQAPSAETPMVTPGEAGAVDKPQFNESAVPMGTPPGGMQINGTRPSGTPPDGMQMNGTRPEGAPPGGMQMNGTRPSGTPPSGTPPS